MSLLHKTENQKKNNDPIIRLMAPMIAGILVCVFCLVSMTWAWFTASVDTPMQTLQSTNRITSVKVYEISQPEDENKNVTKTLVNPKVSEEISLAEDTQATTDEGTIIAGETAVWELTPEKTYEVVMTGSGTASTGYCKVALSHTLSGSDTPETKIYTTSAFEKDNSVKFTYNTGGFSDVEGVTATQYMDYVENTAAPTLAIASYWGKPAEDEAEQVSLMSLRDKSEEIMLLSDGDVLGLAPIPCPEAKAETEIELEGFEAEECAEISAEEDYKVSLTLKEGYEMPSEVVVNIDGKDYVVSTGGSEASDDAPYYDAGAGVLTVPSALLSDGIKVSVKATATPIPEEPEEEETEEATEETSEEETEETTDDNETEDGNSNDTSSGNNVVIDNPNKKEEDGENDSDEPVKTPAGGGGNDDDDDKDDNNSGNSSNGNTSSSGNNEEETEDEKADVTLNLSQLIINLEETQIPTNADLVLTLSAKEDMELPKQIVITLDKTIRDENTEDEEITEDKTEYIINTDGKDNPEGVEFDAESGELTISSELLENVREITIADTEENKADKDDEKATLTFEVKNLTFDFTDDEIVTDEDVVITFTAGEGYELPETIIITIDGVEYIIYTSEEDSDKNPEGITFDIETGTLTISKDLLSDAEAITIAAEGVEKEDEESKDVEENPDADKKDESEDTDNTDNENEADGDETTDKESESGTDTPNTEDKTETEGGTDTPNTDDKTEPEGGTDTPGGENTEATTPEANPDDTTDSESNDDNNSENNSEGESETETSEPDIEVTTPTTPDTEDNTNTEQGDENVETEENGEGSTENVTEETTPDSESGGDDETITPTEPTAPAEPSEPAVSPETPSTSESATGGNDGDDNGETTNVDNTSSESSNNSGNDSTQSDASSESTTSTSPSVTPTPPTTSAPAASETSTPSASTQASGNLSSSPASSTPAPSTNSYSNGVSQASDTTTLSGNKEASSEE